MAMRRLSMLYRARAGEAEAVGWLERALDTRRSGVADSADHAVLAMTPSSVARDGDYAYARR